ncbi:hypothetical protein ES703_21034 [subsurface metagenome]
MATGAWEHLFPVSKDVHPEYIDWPTVGYDKLIALFLHEIFTALDAIQDALGYDITGAFANLNARLEQLDHATKAHGYYDRGDPATYDKAKEDLTIDGAWHDWDLSAIVPAGAKAVLLIGHVEGAGTDWSIWFRKNGNTNEINHGEMETLRANVERCRMIIVACDDNRVIEYKADNVAWVTLNLAVRGWWIR